LFEDGFMVMSLKTQVARRTGALNPRRSSPRWTAVLVAALGCALSAGSASAQNLKVGVINVAKLLEQAPQSKAVTEKLQKEFEPRQQTIMAARQKLQTQQDTFQKDQAVMGEEERLNLERQIRDGQRDLQRTENEYLEDLNARRNEELGRLQREVLQRVQAYASAQKYDLVVADAIYFSSAVDITAAVVAALNQPGAAAPAPAPSAPAPKR
jgi:outer membrane protein